LKKLILTAVSGLLMVGFTANSQEQDWRSAPLDANSNYFEIVTKERAFLETLSENTDRISKKKIKQFERWAAFWKDRINADGTFVSEAHTDNQRRISRENNSGRRKTTTRTTTWGLIGPTSPPIASVEFYAGMGRINTVAFNAANVTTMYIGAASGGVWKTADGGSTWAAQGDGLPNLGVSHIVIDPTNANVAYLASGDFDGIHTRSVGVFKTTDGGANWVATGLTFTLGDNDIISKLLIDPNNTSTVFATTKNSIKRSTDGGSTWSDVYTEANARFNDIMYKSGSSTTIYATNNYGDFLISTDNGSNFTWPSSPGTGRVDLAITAHDPSLIMALNTDGAVKKSTDDGATWSTVSTIAGYNSQGGYNMALAVSPLDKTLILAGGMEGWRSKDAGATWEKYLDGYWQTGSPYFYVHSDHHDMLFVPGTSTAFSVNDGGIFKGDAALDTKWTDLSSGLAITQYYNISGTPQNTNLLILGAQDNDVAVYNGTTFTGENAGSDGVEGLWDYSNSDIAWSCSQSGGTYRTTNGFVSGAYLNNMPAGAPFVWELEIHPTVPTTIFGGFDDIYKSTDRGDNWSNLNSGVGTVEFISISPSNADVIYVAGESQTVKVTTDGGSNWTTITLPQGGSVKSIEVHPTDPTEVYIAYSGYLAGKVYKSNNSGVNWTNITGSLPNIPTHKILYNTSTTDGELFLATDLGVYYRTNTMGDWALLGTGLPNVIVADIEIHYGAEKLKIATFGRGAWEADISNLTVGNQEGYLAVESVTLLPNPTENKQFTINLNSMEGATSIVVFNAVGGVVSNFTTSQSQVEVDLSNYSRGLYFVLVSNNGKSVTKKLIVK
jgi:xyloglucan-specific exo-beta-1,4-glucanase